MLRLLTPLVLLVVVSTSIARDEEAEWYHHYFPDLLKRSSFLRHIVDAEKPSSKEERSLRKKLLTEQMNPSETFKYQLGWDGPERKAIVFYPSSMDWPGNNAQVVVIADATDTVLAWKEVGGEPMYLDSNVAANPDNPVLEIVCRLRFKTNRTFSIFRYSLKDDQIKEIDSK